MRLIDCHAHSLHSIDADFPIKQMCDAAIAQNLAAFAITDHVEANRWFDMAHYGKTKTEYEYDEYGFSKAFYSSIEDIVKSKEEYKDKLNLLCGVELGQAIQDTEIADLVARDDRLDFIIGSIHEARNNMDFAFINFTEYLQSDIQKLLEQYFCEINELANWGKFQILGHLTYTLRYIEGNHKRKVDISKYDDIIESAFKALVKNGCAIEINTSGLRQAYGQPFPTLKYVKMFRDLGGEFLSLGSDAHFSEHVGANISDGAKIAVEAGFDRICYFKNKKPQFIELK